MIFFRYALLTKGLMLFNDFLFFIQTIDNSKQKLLFQALRIYEIQL